MSRQCIDRVVGEILATWRYDISGLAAEMRGDYEAHFAECERCRARRRLHRTIDVGLIIVASVSAGLFALAFAVIRYLSPRHAILLQVIALMGFAFSAVVWLVVAVSTPAPIVMADAARLGARRIHERVQRELRDRLPLGSEK